MAYRVEGFEPVVGAAEVRPCMSPVAAWEEASRRMGTAVVVVEIRTYAVVVVVGRCTWAVAVAGRIACWDPGGRQEAVVRDDPFLGIRGIVALGLWENVSMKF